MKKFTSHLSKLFIFSFIFFPLLFLGSFNVIGAGSWNSTYYLIRSQNTDNGRVEFDFMYQKVGGDGSVIPIGTPVYLQYQTTSGSWVNCFNVYQYGTRSYGVSTENGTSAYWTSGTLENFNGWGAGNYHAYISMGNPTPTYNSSINFRWVQDGNAKGTFTLTFYKPTAPIGLSASTNVCNQVNLTWSQPSNFRAGSNNYYIYRNGSYIGSSSTTSYSDNTPADGTSYNYKVLLNNSYQSGEYSSEVTGNSIPIPVPPSNVSASDDRCDGTVYVQWIWTSSTPDNFEIQRSTSQGSGYSTLSNTLSGGLNYYEDTPPNKNVIYYYRLRAKNNCGDWGTYSTGVPGSAPAAPAAPGSINYTIQNNIVHITWADNSFNETKFMITRNNIITGVKNDFDIGKNITSFNDNNAQFCIPYEYELKAVNNCGSSSIISTGNVLLTPDLSNTFTASSFKASKGFFPDIVHMEWNNNNRNQIDAYYIYRKVYGSTDSTLLSTLDASQASFDDRYAENGILYEYSIIAEGLCDTVSAWSNVANDIGFRNPAGVVSGKVTYGSGEPVKGITVTAESDDLLETTSLGLNGTSSYLEIPNNSYAIQNAFTFQTYIRLSQIKNSAIFNKGGQYELNYTGTNFEFYVGSDSLQFTYSMPLDTFVHISAVYNGSSSFLYINGELMRTKNSVTSISNNTSPFIIGKKAASNYLSGYVDEIRIWQKALDSLTIKNDYKRYISFRQNDIIGYYRLNENIAINTFFDISKSGLDYNENHGTMHNCTYSPIVPEIEQLWFRGLTDKNGDYLITGIPYLTDGSSFNIVPLLSPHEFNPSGKTLFMSDESQVHNNIDFIDISSFMVNGFVTYRNTTLGVKGVEVLVDGDLLFGPDAKPEVTDALGRFEIKVPIGNHYISFRKDGHFFDAGGRWPYEPSNPDSIVRHNFIQNITFSKPFIDTTLITVVGRLIGGTSSNTIPLGFGQSVNNIGKGTITIDHSSSNPELTFDNLSDGIGKDTVAYSVVSQIDTAGSRTFQAIEQISERTLNETKIYTNASTGEFVAKLIPEKFSIVSISVDANSGKEIESFFGNRVIDLSINPPIKKEYLYDGKGQLLDSLEYNIKLNYIYQTPPAINVTNINDTQVFYGEKEIAVKNPSSGVYDTILVSDHFNYPIFNMLKDYSPKISVFESYHNYDTNTDTYQSVKEADIKITNDLAVKDRVKTLQLTPVMNGVVLDTFKVGIPNVTKSELDLTSFTKTMQINVTVDGNTYTWLPGGNLYRAYIIGQRPKGNNFYTEGPQIPEIILRDPPGSGSSAYIEKGSSYSVSSSYSTNFDNGSGFGAEILLGVKVAAGGGLAGPVISTDNKNSGETGLSFSTSIGTSGEYIKSYEFSERIETSSAPGVVGSMGDIYIGKSYNYFYGETDNLKIIPKALADINGVTALGDNELPDTVYTLGLVEGFILDPDNSDTYFKYTQAHILNKLLPELESRRNNLFLTSKRSDGTLKYQTEIGESDLRYAIAHSYKVEIAGADTIVKAYYKMTDTDSILTYSFRPEKQTIQDLNNIKNDTIYENDSIKYFNDQIGIWIDAIRLNETEKALAIDGNVIEQNISFDGAVGAISRMETQTISYNKEESRTKNMHFGAKGSVGFAFNGVGIIATGELSIDHSLGVSAGENFSQTMQYGYTLQDGDVGDYYSINVYRRPESGIYNATDLQETKLEMPSGFDFGILGQGVALVGGAISVAAAASYNAGGGIPIVAGAATMAIAAGLSYIPFVSFQDDVTEQGDRFSPGDIRISSFDISSPIFSTLGGQTMCPFQDLEHTFFYRDAQGDSVVLHKPTLQREKPEITAEPADVSGVPITDKAFFNLKLANNTESGDDQWYTLNVVAKSNPNGAAVKIDGGSPNITVLIPAGETINKLLSISPTNNSIMDYDNIGIVIHSICQYDPTDFMPDISDTVFVSAHFQPACTNVEVLEPLDNFVVNVNDHDTMTIRLGGYNLGYESFESFRFEYKASSGSIWVPVKYFVNDSSLINKDEILDTLFVNNQPFVTFPWDMTALKDREYDIRAVSVCSDGSENVSTILHGILDGQRPQVFGTPQPADGILNIDENISIQFNEPIEGGLLNEFNFEIKGTLNNYLLKHEAYLRFNGTTDYASVSEGISFNDKSFTIEFWMRPDNYQNSVVFSQGNDPAKSLEIGITDNDETYFKIGNSLFTAPFQFTSAVPANEWQHMAYVFDYSNGDVFIYQNDKIILEVRSAVVTYSNSGKIYIGKSAATGTDYFEGSLHELRIWSKIFAIGDIYENQYTALSGNEIGLYGYWPADDAFGKLAIDKAANRHMDIFAQWEAYPGGISWDFTGNNYLEFYTGYFSIIPEMDYTIEFWFKDSNPLDTVCLFSNQKGDGNESLGLLNKALSIYATPDGKIWVASKGNTYEAVSNDFFDNSWHHFALVVHRRGNATSFIDGEPQNEHENSILGGISGGKMHLGVRKWDNVNGTGNDRYYTGKMDEFRLWDLARSATQIKLDMNSKLAGDEIGLMVYYPFEGYYEDNQGYVQQESSLENFVADVNAADAIAANGNLYSNDSPNMKDVRPVQAIAYDPVASEDKIIINPKTYLYPQLEKNIIEITVQGVEDKYGNRMASPVTWTAYVHRNQVRWEDERRIFTKELYQPFKFASSIKNTGGQQVGFSIINLPAWLTASPSSGVINPESTLDITFTVNPALNIGEYNHDIILRTENGFDEKLPLTMRVYKKPPNWTIDPARFENTMSIVGKVKIDGVFSTDMFDMLAAFKKGTDSIRGVSNVRYIEEFDSYYVFMTVYGNVGDNKAPGDSLDFLIWDASVGQILDNVIPFKVVLIDNSVMGTTINPTIFESTGYTRQHIVLREGWNWVSFNKLSAKRNNLDEFFWALEPDNKDLIKTHGGSYSQYSGNSRNWSSGISSIDFKRMYQMKSHKLDTIVFNGTSIVPEDNPITLVTGWNHIGYIPDLTMDVSDALRNFVPAESDIIKSQSGFAMFDSRVGWLGSLDVMQTGKGYMLKVNGGGSPLLTYPNTTVLKNSWILDNSSPPLGWENDLLQYESNLSVVAKLDVGDMLEVAVNTQMVLGAFINGECHGFVSAFSDVGVGYNPFFLNVSNNNPGQQIEFRLFDGLTGNSYSIVEVKPFIQDAVYGNTKEPFILTLKGLITGTGEFDRNTYVRCYPNPFNSEVNVEFSGSLNVNSIDVITSTGSLVKQIFNGNAVDGNNLIKWNGTNGNGAEVTAGIYYIRIVTDNGVETVKISKSK